MYTFGQLKKDIRLRVFPTGEASNLRVAHDAFFLDALVDLQKWVACLQQDNTDIYPQCSTYYKCGLSVFPAPRGRIKGIQVIDKIDPTTGKEIGDASDDYCSAVAYNQVDQCHIQGYLTRSKALGCRCSPNLFFGIGWAGDRYRFPTPTDEGLPSGLKPLALGFHYPQPSTDRPHGRAGAGIWAIMRGEIWLAPWLQSTESVLVIWDGIKRSWSDSEPVDDDPMLKLAIEEYVRWQHAGKFDKDMEEAQRAQAAFIAARADLIHECREETRVRECEPSHARNSASNASVVQLFYNERQSATASCPEGATGNPTSATVDAGTVSSTISVADANQKAADEALAQAQAQLDCQTQATTYTSVAQTATASCQAQGGAPAPDGSPVTITLPAGAASSTISQTDADAQAHALAMAQAKAQLSCTFWNRAKTFTAVCPENELITQIVNIAAHTFSSTVSQADADAQALNAAKTQAESSLSCSAGTFFNTLQMAAVTKVCVGLAGGGVNTVLVTVTVQPGRFSSLASIFDANNQALLAAQSYATQQAVLFCATHNYGSHTLTLP